MADLRYQHFTFPLAIISDELQKLTPEPASPSRDRLLAWLKENDQSEATLLDLPARLCGRQWNAVIAAAIENGIGTVFCPGCHQVWPLASVKRDQWNYMDMGETTGVVVAAAGRQFQCPDGHEVFRTEDYFGCM